MCSCLRVWRDVGMYESGMHLYAFGMHVCIYECVRALVPVYVRIWYFLASKLANMYALVCICMYVKYSTHIARMHAYMQAHVPSTFMDARTHAHTRTRTRTCVHTLDEHACMHGSMHMYMYLCMYM